MPPTNEDMQIYSRFAKTFDIPSIESDPARWNKGWEKALHTLCSDDVYAMMSEASSKAVEASELSQMVQAVNDQLCSIQKLAAKAWDDLGRDDHFVSIWLLLDEGERKRHLMNGLTKTCRFGTWSQDMRAMCPEITISSLLKQRGRAFIDFFQNYGKAIKDVGEGSAYLLPSEWWDKAVDMPEPWPEECKLMFRFLTLLRNDFIARFIVQSVSSIADDVVKGGPGMDPVIEMLKSDASFAESWAKTLSNVPDKPILRCENCAKTPEELGKDIKFMVCSSCRSKLSFTLHYCSQECQKDDWPKHKKHCGKAKVSKKLPGTVHDPFWITPDFPDYLRSNPFLSDTGEGVHVNTIGFGTPHPTRPHSHALQRQVSLMNGDKDADYFLFDDMDRPICLVLYDRCVKMMFRIIRSFAMFSEDPTGVGAIAQYLIEVMGNEPGLSRERILAQLDKEYEVDVTSMMAKFETRGSDNGTEPGVTFVEIMSKNISTIFGPQLTLPPHLQF